MGDFVWNEDALEQFRSGSPAILDAIYRTYADLVTAAATATTRRMSRRIGACSPLIADFVQDVFEKAFQPAVRARVDGRQRYDLYLRTMARNVVIDHFRRRNKIVLLEPERLAKVAEDQASSASLTNDVWADPPTLQSVEALLGDLGADLQDVYRALYVDNLSQREAAIALRIGRQQIRTLSARLRRELRQQLE